MLDMGLYRTHWAWLLFWTKIDRSRPPSFASYRARSAARSGILRSRHIEEVGKFVQEHYQSSLFEVAPSRPEIRMVGI